MVTVPMQLAETVGVAALLGAAIGLERQWHQGMAGIRTNALVATAASAFAHLPLAAGLKDVQLGTLAGAVISGIGFLGAGVILREGMNVRGLNTAATLWGTAAVGVYAGVGLGRAAAEVTLAILVLNIVVRPLISLLDRFGARFSAGMPTTYTGELVCLATEQASIRTRLVEHAHAAALRLTAISTTAAPDRPEAQRIAFTILGFGRVDRTVEGGMPRFFRRLPVPRHVVRATRPLGRPRGRTAADHPRSPLCHEAVAEAGGRAWSPARNGDAAKARLSYSYPDPPV
jgi:putative Mg2+ transporter-C (MgtC) family protein